MLFSEESDSDEEFLFAFVKSNVRRPKLIRFRPDYIHDYDDVDFLRRFRLSKNSVFLLHEILEEQLRSPSDR